MYNKDFRWWVAGTKPINTVADAFRLAHHSPLKLKKYEGLVYNDKHTIAEINQMTDTLTNTKVGNRQNTAGKDLQNKANKTTPFGAVAEVWQILPLSKIMSK